MCLIPQIRNAVHIPLIAAGGIGTGKQMLAAFVLGAEAVQIGSAFAATQESSAHQAFKQQIVDAKEGGTLLTLKQLTPVRLMKNEFFEEVQKAELRGASIEELNALLGRARAKRGMFEGDMAQGELEIGQVSALINEIPKAGELLQHIWNEFNNEKQKINSL
jgi:enoyl-[acyl-carrier protein] reductase II